MFVSLIIHNKLGKYDITAPYEDLGFKFNDKREPLNCPRLEIDSIHDLVKLSSQLGGCSLELFFKDAQISHIEIKNRMDINMQHYS